MTTLMQKVINKYKRFLLVSMIMFLPVNMSSALSQEPSLLTAGAGAFGHGGSPLGRLVYEPPRTAVSCRSEARQKSLVLGLFRPAADQT